MRFAKCKSSTSAAIFCGKRQLDDMPVYGTIASQFNDTGTNSLFAALVTVLNEKCGLDWETSYAKSVKTQKQNVIIPTDRYHYLREIADTVRDYHKKSEEQVKLARKIIPIGRGH